jgi:ParB-like chromosome segregation protein Spo0J
MAVTKQLVALPTKSIVRIADASHPLHDPRASRAVDEFTLADYRQRGQQTPIAVITRENAERIGCAFEGGDYAIVYGNGRHIACEAVGIELMLAFVEEIDSLAQFLTLKMRENSIRDEETPAQLLAKAALFRDACLASGVSVDEVAEQASISLRKPTTTVRTLLKLADPTATVPAVAEMFKSGELEIGSVGQIVSLDKAEQKEAVSELAKVQNGLLTAAIDSGKLAEAAETGKPVRVKTADGDTATLTVKPDGTPVVKPSQDTVQKTRSRVKGTKAPESIKTEGERKKTAMIDASMLGAYRGKIEILARMGDGHDYMGLVMGARLIVALSTGATEFKPAADDRDDVKAAYESEMVKTAVMHLFGAK